MSFCLLPFLGSKLASKVFQRQQRKPQIISGLDPLHTTLLLQRDQLGVGALTGADKLAGLAGDADNALQVGTNLRIMTQVRSR